VTLAAQVEHHRARCLQEALSEATSHYWRRRAATFEAARPRPGDYSGRATPERLAERDATLAAIAHACRLRADLSLLQTDIKPEVLDALAEVA
jgi:hypothetical protein